MVADIKLKYWSLERKLVLYLLTISTCVTTVLTFGTFFIDYKSEIEDLEQVLNQIKTTSIPTLKVALWDFNVENLKSNLEGLKNISDIEYVAIRDSKGKILHETSQHQHGGQAEAFVIRREYPIVHSSGEALGVLEVVATQEHLIFRLVRKISLFFVTQFIKTIAVSFLIMLVIRRSVTGPIYELKQHLERARDSDLLNIEEFEFKSKKLYRDELDDLLTSFNSQQQTVVDLNRKNMALIKSQGQEIDLRRSEAIESARLVSLGEMSSGIAHEINNPIAVIKGYAGLIQNELPHAPEYQKSHSRLIRIIEMVDRISKITQSMRLSARDGSDDPFLPVTVKDIVEDALILCEWRFKNHGVDLRTQIACDPLTCVSGRRVQLSQVLTNLFNNAFDAVSAAPVKWIELKALVVDENVVFSVVDSGSGIPSEVLSKIFHPFFTTKEVGKGTGLGLSISMKIAKDHGGSLGIGPNRSNTEFVWKIPVLKRSGQAGEEAQSA